MNALQQVEDNLRYIRHTLEEAGTFTNISAVGLLLVGLIGLAAAAFTVWRIGLPSHWTPAGFQTFLLAWTAAACLAAPPASPASRSGSDPPAAPCAPCCPPGSPAACS